ncbi:hypothetical protein GCM10022226_02020 [Sphaerisporangium flaviroseum]|uniref:Uncharacterized protein n=1 Tax=Sphaerisporangium flaviroseum TaxID=509199 RepID=A0ABP7H9E6_9ACTN
MLAPPVGRVWKSSQNNNFAFPHVPRPWLAGPDAEATEVAVSGNSMATQATDNHLRTTDSFVKGDSRSKLRDLGALP